MPKKLHVLLSALAKAGFVNRGGKGSHRNYIHPCGHRLTVSVHAGEAKPYQQRAIEDAIRTAGAGENPHEEKISTESGVRPLS